MVTYDLPEDYLATYPGKVEGTTSASLTKLANDWVLPDNMAVMVVGDRLVIEPGIRELNLGKIVFLDEDGNRVTENANREE